MRFYTSVLAGTLAAALQATALQSDPEFDVASIKLSAPLEGPMAAMRNGPMADSMIFCNGGPGTRDPERFTCSGVSLKQLLMRSAQVKAYQIQGPAWIATERYDIQAKVPPGTDAGTFRLMLRRLITERFKIQSHQESKTQQAYSLTVAKNGPKLKPPQPKVTDPAELRAANKARMEAMMATMQARRGAGERGPSRSVGLQSGTVTRFAELLSQHLNALVIDETGVDGEYSFDLVWSPDDAGPRPADIENASTGPTIFAAIQEQLGLKLESVKRPIDVLIVDKAERTPIEN
jgi:uncharacterized protein (TIGR03435 family)